MELINIRKLTIEDKNLINGYLEFKECGNSELSFTNLFIWRKSYNVRFAEVKNKLVVFSKHHDSPEVVYFPIGKGDKKEVLDEIIKYYKEKNEELHLRISCEGQIDYLNYLYPDKFIIEENIDEHDYVYEVQALCELKGKKYHAKRNFVNRFKNKYNLKYERLTYENKDACLELFKKWIDEKSDDIKGLNEQFEAVSTLLENWENLDIKGGGFFDDGKMVAFSFGEELLKSREMAVIHLEHANTEYEGVYPAINNAFLTNEFSDFKYVNREEDMGLTGLRKAKQSYYPAFMSKKYIARLK